MAVYEVNGQDLLPSESRGRATRPLVDHPITAGDAEGEGIKEFVLRNITGELHVRSVVIQTLEAPFAAEGGTLLHEWSYYDEGREAWSLFAPRHTVRDIGPGRTVRLRSRLKSSAEHTPRSYLGSTSFPYEYVAVG